MFVDSEGDFVAIDDDDDVQVAVLAVKDALLKLYVVCNGEKEVSEAFGVAPTGKEEPKKSGSGAKASESQQSATGVHHPSVVCDGCNSAIYGRRFKCVECSNFDLCERCELVENRHPEHSMLLIRRPRSGPRGFPGCFPMFGFGRGPHHGGPHHRGPHRGGPYGGPWGRGPSAGPRCGGPMDGAPFPGFGACGPFAFCGLNLPNDAPCPASRCGSGAPRGTEPHCGQTDMEAEAAAEQPTQPEADAGGPRSFESELISLLEMGFDNDNGWLEQLLASHDGNVGKVLDMLMGRSAYSK